MENTTDLIYRLARSCAHGSRQLELVNEMIAGPIEVQKIPVPTTWETATVYGECRLEGRSWKNLRKRLAANGFFFTHSRDRRFITLNFSA